jgi:hypothetical protein
LNFPEPEDDSLFRNPDYSWSRGSDKSWSERTRA